jgi:hypothetical protein
VLDLQAVWHLEEAYAWHRALLDAVGRPVYMVAMVRLLVVGCALTAVIRHPKAVAVSPLLAHLDKSVYKARQFAYLEQAQVEL